MSHSWKLFYTAVPNVLPSSLTSWQQQAPWFHLVNLYNLPKSVQVPAPFECHVSCCVQSMGVCSQISCHTFLNPESLNKIWNSYLHIYSFMYFQPTERLIWIPPRILDYSLSTETYLVLLLEWHSVVMCSSCLLLFVWK